MFPAISGHIILKGARIVEVRSTPIVADVGKSYSVDDEGEIDPLWGYSASFGGGIGYGWGGGMLVFSKTTVTPWDPSGGKICGSNLPQY